MYYIALILFTLTACNTEALKASLPTPRPVRQDPELAHYASNYSIDRMAYTGERGNYLAVDIEFVDDLVDMAGLCTRYSNGRNLIQIDRPYFETITPLQRTILMYHEMAHCMDGQDHREFSIMQVYLMDDDEIDRFYSDLLRELFTKEPVTELKLYRRFKQ